LAVGDPDQLDAVSLPGLYREIVGAHSRARESKSSPTSSSKTPTYASTSAAV
jgi:hypothetical protein